MRGVQAKCGLGMLGSVLLLAQALALADEPNPQAKPRGAAPPPRQPAGGVVPRLAEQEKAIRAVADAFLKAYNAGDAKALAALFTENAEVVDVDGSRQQGRGVIEQMFKDTFAASPGIKMAVAIDSIRILGPEAAKEEGRTTLTPADGGAPVARRYSVLYVKRNGQWLHDSVREDAEPQAAPREHLRDLEWMLGEWVDEGNESLVRSTCRWSDDRNYLLRHFSVQVRGRPVMVVDQRVGWDPSARQIRSWEFDSEGGFGQGLWARDGERWLVKHSGVMNDGQVVSATRVFSQDSPDRVRWASTDQVVGGRAVPDTATFVMVRVPPAPAATTMAPPDAAAPAAPATNPRPAVTPAPARGAAPGRNPAPATGRPAASRPAPAPAPAPNTPSTPSRRPR